VFGVVTVDGPVYGVNDVPAGTPVLLASGQPQRLGIDAQPDGSSVGATEAMGVAVDVAVNSGGDGSVGSTDSVDSLAPPTASTVSRSPRNHRIETAR
jgi:hypothetical protein